MDVERDDEHRVRGRRARGEDRVGGCELTVKIKEGTWEQRDT